MQINVARRYGLALFELANERNVLERIAADIRTIDTVLSKIPEFVNLFSSPVTKAEKLQKILEKAFKPIVHELTWEFLKILVQKKRVSVLKGIPLVFNKLYNDCYGIVDVTVESVYPLSDNEKTAIILKLEEKTGKKVHLDFKLNKRLLAGFKLYMGEKLKDCSIAGKLQRLRTKMLSA
jgi:F-type H+-transporting ATPase subunit delta